MLSLSLTSHLLALQTEVSNTDVQLRISPVLSSPLQPWLSAGWSDSDYSELLRGWDYFSLSASLHLSTSLNITHTSALLHKPEIENQHPDWKAPKHLKNQWKISNPRLDFFC